LTANKDITGVNAFESARNPYALNLDGASWAEVHDNASLDITSAITLEAWVYWDSTEAAKGIVGKWNSASTQCYLIYVESSSRAQFYTSTTGSNAQSVEHTIPSDGWVHIVGTDDGTNQKLYINGAEEATRASFGSIFANDRVLEIGRFNEATIRQYTNQIAQPRIYNRALTATEVLRNYNADKSKFGL
jgi:flagellar capping protein FliD